jgi:hypothetical protein
MPADFAGDVTSHRHHHDAFLPLLSFHILYAVCLFCTVPQRMSLKALTPTYVCLRWMSVLFLSCSPEQQNTHYAD